MPDARSPPKPSALAAALATAALAAPASGARTPSSMASAGSPPGDLAAKGRRYILAADDGEIRAMLLERLEREAAAQDPPLLAGAGGAASQRKAAARRVRLRDLVFTQRFSTFDRQNPLSAESPFHGFFTLFWLGIALMLVKAAALNHRATGSVLGGAEVLHIMFDRDIVVLGLTDGVMVGSTVFGLGLQKLVLADYVRWRPAGWVIQNVWQTMYLAAIIAWTYYRDWPWTHTIFIVLHTLVFVMKQHSYAFYNGYLSQLYRRKCLLETKLSELSRLEVADQTSRMDALTTGFEKEEQSELKLRLTESSLTNSDPKNENSRIGSIINAIDRGAELDQEAIEDFTEVLRNELKALNTELHGKTKDPTKQYPNNLTLYNWLDYTVLPTLVYELEYPRQDHINWWYVAEKATATLGIIWVMIMVSQAHIYPLVAQTVAMKEAGMPLAERWAEFPYIVADLLFPLLLEQLLAWYVIWECTLNVLAELTGFADRNFYGAWWNSVSFESYAREWNLPVHNFLLRHVYNSSISAFHLSKGAATFFTFLLSALVHELLMLVIFKKVRGYLFAMQLLQLPLVSLSRSKLLKGKKLIGNLIFWIGLIIGPGVLASLYLIV